MSYRIEIKVDAADKGAAINFFEKLVAELRTSDWGGQAGGGGGNDGAGYSVYVGPRPLSMAERIERLESRIPR